MTLQKIKDKYAKEKGYPNWDDLSKEHRYRIVSYEKHMDNICILAQKQVLYNVAENAKAISSGYTESVWHCGCSYEVHKESILNESNLVL